MKIKHIISRRGETLVEVLIALSLLVVGAMGALGLLNVAAIHNQLSSERVIATNLAREGIEAVHNIRDTNWLRFAGERRICWNNNDKSDPIECHDTDNDGVADEPILHGRGYIAEFDDTTYRWELQEQAGRLDIKGGIGASDEVYRLKINANGLYDHGAGGTDSIYFREIFTEYLQNDGTIPSADEEESNILRVSSKVQWYDRGRISEVVLTTLLTDYLGRRDHN